MTQFQSYQKIATSSQGWQLTPQEWRRLERMEWVVTEKIHGANFGWLCDGVSVRCAKRKAVLAPGESFFGHRALLAEYEPLLQALFVLVQKAHPACVSVQLYGELFGGGYPHPEVPPVPGVQPVQTGVYYAPGIEFCAFDLGIHTSEGQEVLGYSEATGYFDEVGLFYAAPLLCANFAEAMAYPCEFSSTIPARLGLPPLTAPNLAEGVVLKPMTPVLVTTSKGLLRPLLKRKIAHFEEDARFHLASKWSEEVAPAPDDLLAALEWRMLSLVTKQRLDSAISKVGALDSNTKAAICAEAVQDAWASLCEEHPGLVAQLSGDDEALLESVLADAVVSLVSSAV